MTEQEQRIKLAEAMGWDPHNYANGITTYWSNEGYPDNDGPWVEVPGFSPFTSADDDYKVLEWMREEADRYPEPTVDVARVYLGFAFDYQIGDYARAALKVLDND